MFQQNNVQNSYIFNNKKDTAYRTVMSLNESFGMYMKTETHIHTPASHDYRLKESENPEYYKKLTNMEILQIAKEEKLVNEEESKVFEQDLNSGKEITKIISNKTNFIDFKEYITYLLIVHKLIKSDIKIAIISDHNNINGYRKLEEAKELYIKSLIDKKSLYIFLGVEISCGDGNHLIGIFNDNDYEKLKNYLDETINDHKDGTYKRSLEIIREIHSKFDSITYIAHIDSSNIFKGTGLYKKELFNEKLIKYMSLSDINNIERMKLLIRNIGVKRGNINYIQDGDSHALDMICKKNIWIKFGKVRFEGLKKAFANFTTCISNSEPNVVEKYIEGIYIYTGEYGFLGENPTKEIVAKKQSFSVEFSKDLNCIIGGRGTGKSTILKFLNTAFSLSSDNLEDLRSICRHSLMYIVFHYENMDYILEFQPQRDFYEEKVFFGSFLEDKTQGKIDISEKWRNVFLVSENKGEYTYTKVENTIANNFFRRGYSINKLVSDIQNDKISEDIKDIVMYGLNINQFNKNISDIINIGKKYSIENILRTLYFISDNIEKKEALIKFQIEKFNKNSIDAIQIIYKNSHNEESRKIEKFFSGNLSKKVKKTIFSLKDTLSLVQIQISSIGILKYLTYLFNSNYGELEKVCTVDSIKSEITQEDIELGINDIKNYREIYSFIKGEIYRSRSEFINLLQELIGLNDKFNLLFNISSSTLSTKSMELKELQSLSLGQQVAALLKFIIDFGEYIGDDTPLIIDQPEDNLDNQYIYNNLVESLKNIKNKRQVIIATHSSTIVTNSETEQVIVLESNNFNGWVKHKGYPTDSIIIKDIISYLEGGEESLKHKIDTYSTILPNIFK